MIDRPVAMASTYTTHNKHEIKTFITPAGFEPAIPTIVRPQACMFHRLDHLWDRLFIRMRIISVLQRTYEEI